MIEPHPPALSTGERLGFFMRERSALYNVAESGVLQKWSLDDLWANWRDVDAQVELLDREKEVYATRLDNRWRDAWALTDALLGRVDAEAKRQGARFGLMLVPTRAQVLPEAWKQVADRSLDPRQPNTLLGGIATRLSTPFLDLTPGFATMAARGGEPLYFARDQHWTAAGHDLAARHMAEWLRSSALLPGSTVYNRGMDDRTAQQPAGRRTDRDVARVLLITATAVTSTRRSRRSGASCPRSRRATAAWRSRRS